MLLKDVQIGTLVYLPPKIRPYSDLREVRLIDRGEVFGVLAAGSNRFVLNLGETVFNVLDLSDQYEELLALGNDLVAAIEKAKPGYSITPHMEMAVIKWQEYYGV